MTAPLRMSFDVACSAGHAFTVWTAGIGAWWPPHHTMTGRAEAVVLQGGVGGRIYERTADGTEHEWGEVIVWQPPARLAYLWYLGRDRADATEVEIRFLVGSTTLKYRLRAIEDLHAWLKARGDWVPLGAADEKKPAADGTVEAWGRSTDNPVGGWYGLRSGYRGRFGMYMPPLLEELGLAEVSHDARNNRMRAI
jgi:uncharacterized protein YndB with AHSA1/START domain